MNENKSGSKVRNRPVSPLKRMILALGSVCLLQFLICGIIGVVRGYSVQSWIPIWVGLAGVVLLIPFQARHNGTSYLSSLFIIIFALVGIGQGKHKTEGEKLYEAGKHEEAMSEFRQEIDTWYLRLQYNYHEAPSLLLIAQCQSQLGRFDEAREAYREIEETFRGYHKDRAQVDGAKVEGNLAKITALEKALAEASDDNARSQVHFDLALVYREMPCAAKAMEQYEAIQKLDADERFKESAKKFADELK